MRLKKQTISLPGFSREWERTDDDFLKQLWADNERLELEVAALKKDNKKLTIAVLLILVLYIIKDKIGKLFSTFKSKQTKEE